MLNEQQLNKVLDKEFERIRAGILAEIKTYEGKGLNPLFRVDWFVYSEESQTIEGDKK